MRPRLKFFACPPKSDVKDPFLFNNLLLVFRCSLSGLQSNGLTGASFCPSKVSFNDDFVVMSPEVGACLSTRTGDLWPGDDERELRIHVVRAKFDIEPDRDRALPSRSLALRLPVSFESMVRPLSLSCLLNDAFPVDTLRSLLRRGTVKSSESPVVLLLCRELLSCSSDCRETDLWEE